MRTSIIYSGLILFAAGCGGEAGSTATVQLSLRGANASSTLAGNDAQGSTFVVKAARAYVRQIEFDLPDGRTCADFTPEELSSVKCDSDKLRVDGPFEVDLATGQSKPSLSGVTIPAGTYKRVDVRFDDAKEVDGIVSKDDPLMDNTLIASGSFDYQGTPTSFDIVLKFNEDARFENPNGIELNDSAPGDVLLWLDVSKWFSTLALTKCLDDGDLRIVDGHLAVRDDGGSCSDVENALKSTIKTSGQLDRN